MRGRFACAALAIGALVAGPAVAQAAPAATAHPSGLQVRPLASFSRPCPPDRPRHNPPISTAFVAKSSFTTQCYAVSRAIIATEHVVAVAPVDNRAGGFWAVRVTFARLSATTLKKYTSTHTVTRQGGSAPPSYTLALLVAGSVINLYTIRHTESPSLDLTDDLTKASATALAQRIREAAPPR